MRKLSTLLSDELCFFLHNSKFCSCFYHQTEILNRLFLVFCCNFSSSAFCLIFVLCYGQFIFEYVQKRNDKIFGENFIFQHLTTAARFVDISMPKFAPIFKILIAYQLFSILKQYRLLLSCRRLCLQSVGSLWSLLNILVSKFWHRFRLLKHYLLSNIKILNL